MAVTLVGVAVGIPCALGAGRLTAALLFGLAPSDPATLAAAAALFLFLGAAAGLIPAFRASRVEPMAALRCD